MKKMTWMAAAALFAAGCCCVCNRDGSAAKAVSPDGKNVIRLWTSPLAYEVARDGVVVVAKTEIGLKVDGACLTPGEACKVTARKVAGTVETPVYKKARIDLAGNETAVDFGAWGIRLAARNDGVAYRFETKKPGTITVDGEKAGLTIPCAEAKCALNYGSSVGCEETVPVACKAGEIVTGKEKGRRFVYLPLVYKVGDVNVAVTESDVYDYPILNLVKPEGAGAFASTFAGFPKRTYRAGGWDSRKPIEKGGRWVVVAEHDNFLVKTEGTRTFPWRVFALADAPAKFCEADIVNALARPQAKGADFSWVKPGKVAWDWWNGWDNKGEAAGCTTAGYKRFIDFAAKTGVEYVILDEGWSETLNIWKFHPNVDVPEIIRYGNEKGVGIILWMAWAQIYGEEEKVAAHFAKLGAKGFKVDFMDRGDAEIAVFLEKFAAACAKHKMLVDYHGVYRPVGLHRTYPNVLNYEGIHGLEQMKWGKVDKDMTYNDVACTFLRMTAGPMDYTPGAMLNYKIGAYKGNGQFPGSVGTRCHQMALMALYEAPLQMLSDSPTHYEKNMECFSFMAKVPVVWDATVGLGGCPECFAAIARKAKDGAWYAAAITNKDARDYTLDTAFLGEGEWKAEIFRDAPACDETPEKYVRETKVVKAGDKLALRMASGGGFIVRFSK